MPYLPIFSEVQTSKINTESFLGYDHKLKISANEWFDMKNITADDDPLMAPRKKRGIVSQLTSPSGLAAKDALLYVDGTKVLYNGTEIDLNLSTETNQCPKRIVSMGAYAVIFPDKKYLNTAKLTEYGSLEASFSSNGTVSYSLCDQSGTAYSSTTSSASAPSDPKNGDYWVDSSGSTHVLKVWSETSAMWIEVPTCCVKISCSGIGAPFKEGDGVTISGAAGSDQITALNKMCVIKKLDADFIVVTGILDQETQQQTGTVAVKRSVPDMDYVLEAQNRLWGCKYGIVDGKTVNELYCCKLGDFKNWNVFSGISTDSWASSVGSDGVFTGAVNYLGYPTFFKENAIHRVAVSSSGAHQVTETVCRGIQKGSERSCCVVGETLLYKSRDGVCAYTGSQPTSISDVFGDIRYANAAAGAIGQKYYISMQDGGTDWNLFCYDIGKGIWTREDNTHAVLFTACDDDLFYIDADTKKLMAVYGTQGTSEDAVSWEAISGIQHYDYAGRKYVGRYNFRMQLAQGTAMTFYLQYDSDGVWRDSGTITGTGTGTFTLPVIPRRCDHLQYKLSGSGDFRLFSITRILEQGSDM